MLELQSTQTPGLESMDSHYAAVYPAVGRGYMVPQDLGRLRHRTAGEGSLRDPLPDVENDGDGFVRLTRAVLIQALKDISAYYWAKKRTFKRDDAFKKNSARNEGQSALAWIASDDIAPWSFLWCCDQCGATPGIIRGMIHDRPAHFARSFREHQMQHWAKTERITEIDESQTID